MIKIFIIFFCFFSQTLLSQDVDKIRDGNFSTELSSLSHETYQNRLNAILNSKFDFKKINDIKGMINSDKIENKAFLEKGFVSYIQKAPYENVSIQILDSYVTAIVNEYGESEDLNSLKSEFKKRLVLSRDIKKINSFIGKSGYDNIQKELKEASIELSYEFLKKKQARSRMKGLNILTTLYEKNQITDIEFREITTDLFKLGHLKVRDLVTLKERIENKKSNSVVMREIISRHNEFKSERRKNSALYKKKNIPRAVAR